MRRSKGIDAGGPYKAEQVGPYGYWIVTNRFGVNVGVFDEQGRTLTNDPSEAEAAAAMFNAEKSSTANA